MGAGRTARDISVRRVGGFMNSLREQFDDDRNDGRYNYSRSPTEQNRFNMYCSTCHAPFYVDKGFYESIVTAMEEGLDNPFVCDDCQQEVDEIGRIQIH